MNSETVERVVSQAAEDLFPAAKSQSSRSILREALANKMEEMKALGEAYELAPEEQDLLLAFRRFKITCKPGAVFKWQTTPAGARSVVIAEDTNLIQHPQEVS